MCRTVGNRNADTGECNHIQIVFLIAERRDLLARNIQMLCQAAQSRAFSGGCIGNFQQVRDRGCHVNPRNLLELLRQKFSLLLVNGDKIQAV